MANVTINDLSVITPLAGTEQVELQGTGAGASGKTTTQDIANLAAGAGITTLTGDVTAGPGSGSQAATIANNAVTTAKINNAAVTLAKIANAAANDKLLGAGNTGSGAAYAEITLGSGLTMTGTTLSSSGSGITTLTGDVTAGPGSGSQAATIAANAVTLAKIAHASASSKVLGSGSSGSGANYAEITLDASLTMSGTTLSVTTGTSGSGIAVLSGANAWGALQSFDHGANHTPATTPATNAIGYLGIPQNIANADYTTVMSDTGKHLYHTSGSAHTWTIDSNANVAYPIGTVLTFVNENGGGNVTLAITSDTLRWGALTGSRTLAANGACSALKVASTVWRLTGDGLT